MGISFDTGALVSLVERRRLSMRKVYDTAVTGAVPMRVSTAVVAEWWRGGPGEKQRGEWLRSMHVEVVTEAIARLAGVAVGRVKGAGTIDAIVLATAAVRGDRVVYTSDVGDLVRLRDNVAEFSFLDIEHA